MGFLTPDFIIAVTGLVTAIGIAIKNVRDTRRGRRELETVARAAAKGPEAVQAVVEVAENTGTFQRLTPRDGE